jgi:hypothetical protein
MEMIKQMKENGWIFKYDPQTKFIGAQHKNGGYESVCEITIRNNNRAANIGYAIANLLNNQSE